MPSSSAFRADSGKPDEQAVEALLSQVFRAAGKEPVPASAVVRLAESMRAVDGQLGDLNQGLRVPEMPLVQAIVMDHFRHVLARLDGESAARAGVDVPTVADGGARVDVPVADGETVSYPLPLPIEDLWGAGDVGRILSPSGRPDRSLARARRLRSELLGVEIGNGWRYPRFQFDVRRKRIHPIVVAVNRRLEVVKDPWGSLEWWYLPAEALGDRSPVDALLSDDFTEESATLLIDLDEQSMV